MPTKISTPERCIEKYIRENKKSSKTETYDQYRTVLNKMARDLEAAGFDPLPYYVTEKAVRYLLDEVWKDLEVSTRKWHTHIFSRYLRFFGNNVVVNMDIRWPQDMRPNVDWLTDAEQYKLLNANLTVKEMAVIHFELNMGLRVAEVCNLKLDCINYRMRTVEVLGKGHGEGKWRSVPFSEETEEILGKWLKERQEIVDRVTAYNPSWVDPGNVFLWCHYKNKPQAGAYSDRGHSIDRGIIHVVRDRLGLTFTNHTLRRTFGRTMYHAGAPIESISKILGHEDIVTTLKYLGINLDDMQAAMDLHGDYQKKIRMGIFPKGGIQNV